MGLLSEYTKCVVLATLHIQKVNDELGHVPDYVLLDQSFKLGPTDMREIRDVVQKAKRDKKPKPPVPD